MLTRGKASVAPSRSKPVSLDGRAWSVTALLVFLAHLGLLAWSAWCHSPVFNEEGRLVAGVSHVLFGRFDLHRVDPPMVRTLGAVPVALASPSISWSHYDDDRLTRGEHALGFEFLSSNGSRSFWLITMARWACAPFSVIGGYICLRWATQLYGREAGMLALVLWCFSPYVLGHAPLLSADAQAAAMALLASYTFWAWLNRPTWRRAFVAGTALGLAELTKFTLVVLYPLWFAEWTSYRLIADPIARKNSRLGKPSMLVAIIALSILVINLGYCCEGSFQRFGDYKFQSLSLAGAAALDSVPGTATNRFASTWIGRLPVPLPRSYVHGIDTQKTDFEQGMRCYLRGQWKMHGWWYFYLYALIVKVPLGTWTLFLLACVVSLFREGYRARRHDEMFVLLPMATVLAFVSMQTGFTIHSRYVIPVLPFAFVWLSKVARSFPLGDRGVACITTLAISWSIAASLAVYPHSLSYFNELVGGPTNGHAHFLDSNIAWGQDHLYLRTWLENHPDARPLHLASIVFVEPRMLGTDFLPPPVGPASSNRCGVSKPKGRLGPLPGWYAVDVNHLRGTECAFPNGTGGWEARISSDYDFSYFLRFKPVAMAGYSIYIYHITLDGANRVRRDLGLPELRAETVSGNGVKPEKVPDTFSGSSGTWPAPPRFWIAFCTTPN